MTTRPPLSTDAPARATPIPTATPAAQPPDVTRPTPETSTVGATPSLNERAPNDFLPPRVITPLADPSKPLAPHPAFDASQPSIDAAQPRISPTPPVPVLDAPNTKKAPTKPDVSP